VRNIYIKLCEFILNFHTTGENLIYCRQILSRPNLELLRISQVFKFLASVRFTEISSVP
jgi:hypothetical protein